MKISWLQKLKIPRLIYIPKLSGCIYKLISRIQMHICQNSKIQYGLNKTEREIRVIVSLTTYSDRINTVYYTLKTLLNQTYKPDKIILWLASDEFSDDLLPDNLIGLKEYGIEFRYCDDLRSHKKYYYTMREFSDDIVITFDDDIIYPENQIEKLIKTHQKYPDCVVANEAKKLLFDDEYNLIYHKMRNEGKSRFGLTPQMMLLPIGCGGVLYPPGCLHEELFNITNIKNLAFTVDDLWLKSMAMLNGVKAVKTKRWIRTLSCVKDSQKTHLAQINCVGGANEVSMKKIINTYPKIKSIIDANR